MLQYTVQEQKRALYWHQRKQEQRTPRTLLHESDELMYWLEECLVQRLRMVPGWLMPRLVSLLQRADPEICRALGSERRPEPILELLFRAQEALMEQSLQARKPARVIPLFR
jgi:hypothetical protein